MCVNVVDRGFWRSVKRTFFHVAYHADNLAEGIILVHPGADTPAKGVHPWEIPFREGSTHNKPVRRRCRVIPYREFAAALHRNAHGLEIAGRYGTNHRNQVLSRFRWRPSLKAYGRCRRSSV